MIYDTIAALQSGKAEAFSEILAEYGPLIESMISKQRSGTFAEEDDLRQEASIALYDAARTYKEEKNKVTFGLYAKICIKNRLISYIRKNSIAWPEMHEDPPTAGDPEQNVIEAENEKKLESCMKNCLSAYEKKVLKAYLAGKSYAEIADEVGRDRKSVDNAISRIKSKLAEKQT